jgi:hypothetical protein
LPGEDQLLDDALAGLEDAIGQEHAEIGSPLLVIPLAFFSRN